MSKRKAKQEIKIVDETHALSTERGTVQDALSTWLLNIESKNTRLAYQKSWQAFIEHTGINHPYDVTYEDMTAYREHLSTTISTRTGKPLSQCTINQKISGISSFYTHAIERGYFTGVNPCDGIKRKAVNPYGKATFLDHEQGQVIKFLSQIDRDTLQGKRDYAIMRLMLATAVRVSVITNAYTGDIKQEGDRWYLYYTNKGGETDKANISGVMGDIADYMLERGVKPGENVPLFTATPRGKRTMKNTGNASDIDKPLRVQSITNLVGKYARAAGLQGITPHSLRHTAALMAAKEGTLAEIKSLLRHKNVRVTGIYLDHLDDNGGDKLADLLADKLERDMQG
jgi:integrase/recombinase XerC